MKLLRSARPVDSSVAGWRRLVSVQPDAAGPEQRDAMRAAFEIATTGSQTIATDWQNNTTPDHWHFRPAAEKTYTWYQETGAWPFGI